jgi:hypothetical protein
MLTQPLDDRLKTVKRILVAGAGGGYDVVCGVPLFLALERLGFEVHLASLSSTPLIDVQYAVRHTDTLLEVTADSSRPSYFPEGWLARWFHERRGRDVTVWSFVTTGVRPYAQSYAYLAQHLNLDAIMLIDGGVDTLMRGDEHSLGTPLWDALSIAAVDSLDIPHKFVATTAFGAERWDRISHSQVFARIADMTRADALLGVTTLLRSTDEGAAYIDAVQYIFDHQPEMRQSVVASSMLAALRGDFGEMPVNRFTEMTPIWVSPLMCLYWFFDLGTVARQKLFLPRLLTTDTVTEAADRMQQFMDTHPPSPWQPIPI